MREAEEQPGKKNFFDLAPNELDALVSEWGWKRFRADQLRDWVYSKLAQDEQQMSNLARKIVHELHNLLRSTAPRSLKSNTAVMARSSCCFPGKTARRPRP